MEKFDVKKIVGKYLPIGVLAGGALMYAGDKLDVNSKVVDLFTVDAGEAAEKFVQELKEEQDPSQYTAQLQTAMYEASIVMSDLDASVTINKRVDSMSTAYQSELAKRTTNILPAAEKADVVKNSLEGLTTGYQFKIIKKSADKIVEEQVGMAKEKAKEFYDDMK